MTFERSNRPIQAHIKQEIIDYSKYRQIIHGTSGRFYLAEKTAGQPLPAPKTIEVRISALSHRSHSQNAIEAAARTEVMTVRCKRHATCLNFARFHNELQIVAISNDGRQILPAPGRRPKRPIPGRTAERHAPNTAATVLPVGGRSCRSGGKKRYRARKACRIEARPGSSTRMAASSRLSQMRCRSSRSGQSSSFSVTSRL